MSNPEYIPFGEEWEKEVSKTPKPFIIKMAGKLGTENTALKMENERLREALQKISKLPDEKYGEDGKDYDPDETVNEMTGIAKQTLNPNH